MGLTEESVDRLQRQYPGLTVLARRGAPHQPSTVLTRLNDAFPRLNSGMTQSIGAVMAVRIAITGIRGRRSTLRCTYDVIIDTSNLLGKIPTVWVARPLDSEIKHVNIWPAAKSFCRWTGANLPSVCWHTYADAWDAAPMRARTLGNVLEYTKQLLNTENHDSPAR